MKVKFVLPYAGTESAPADYKPGDEAVIFDDAAFYLKSLGVVEFVEEPVPVKESKKKGAK